MSEHNATNATDSSCNACPLIRRRNFLADAARAAAAAVLTIGATPQLARALAGRMGQLTPALRGEQAAYPLPTRDGAAVDRDREVILVRFEGAIYAFALSCPHQNTALRWNEGENRFQCSKHHSKYRPDGTFIDGRATRGMDRYAIRLDGERVVVDLTTAFQEDHDAAAWRSAVVHLA